MSILSLVKDRTWTNIIITTSMPSKCSINVDLNYRRYIYSALSHVHIRKSNETELKNLCFCIKKGMVMCSKTAHLLQTLLYTTLSHHHSCVVLNKTKATLLEPRCRPSQSTYGIVPQTKNNQF